MAERNLISLGHRCDVAFQLRMHGAENIAHFFDWLATPADGLIKIIEADFDVFAPDHLRLKTDHIPNCVEDVCTGVLFHHQFPMFNGHVQPDFLTHYSGFIAKFQHLAARFKRYLRERPVTLVRQTFTHTEALRLEAAVLALCPDADVKFLYVNDPADPFETAHGKSVYLHNDWSSLGNPENWSAMLLAEGLITEPYRRGTPEILGAAHDDHNLSTDNRFSEAQLRAAIAANPRSITYPLELARLFALRHDWAQAEEWAVAALARNPRDPAAQFQAARAQWRMGRLAAHEAGVSLAHLAGLDEALPEWKLETSEALMAAGERARALHFAARALVAEPLTPRYYLQKADCLFALHRLSDMALTLQAAARLGELAPKYQHMLANGLEARGELEAATAAAEKALAGSEDFGTLYTLAGLKLRQRDFDSALALCERARPMAGELLPALEARIAEIEAQLNPSSGEAVRMVIWDLDETFWDGTLSEGGISPIPDNIELVKTLSARGIVNSICSKNHFDEAKAALAQLDVWEYFVFPKIAFAPKGAMVRDIIETSQLRAASVLFIDDNPMNLNEALHYAPGVQVAAPSILAGLRDDPRLAGKPDPGLERLARYRVLQKKQDDQQAAQDNTEFLRSADVRISFHHDVMEQFPRIHELVNRTNQLNFTKRRWPEDERAARAVAEQEFAEIFGSHWGYVKVADRYGNYGICGFFLERANRALHFLFSCRAMNMGVEQFVWARIGRPEMTVQGEVTSTLGASPDWISVVDDAEAPTAGGGDAFCYLSARRL